MIIEILRSILQRGRLRADSAGGIGRILAKSQVSGNVHSYLGPKMEFDRVFAVLHTPLYAFMRE